MCNQSLLTNIFVLKYKVVLIMFDLLNCVPLYFDPATKFQLWLLGPLSVRETLGRVARNILGNGWGR